MENRAKLQQAFQQYVLTRGERPISVRQITDQADLPEAAFYEVYNSIRTLEKDIWRTFVENTRQQLRDSEVYPTYTTREKLLAFYYTWLEVLKENRSYVLYVAEQLRRGRATRGQFSWFMDDFTAYIDDLVREGQETGEIAQRPFITDLYGRVLYRQALFLLRVFVRDDSDNFETTDAAIEKAVHFAFDIIGRNAVDSGLDFVRFLFQNRKRAL